MAEAEDLWGSPNGRQCSPTKDSNRVVLIQIKSFLVKRKKLLDLGTNWCELRCSAGHFSEPLEKFEITLSVEVGH